MRNGMALGLALAGGAAACGGAQRGGDELDVTRVVLYQSGIAYIERAGEVRGEELVMQIRPDQINDILTSLVVVDRSGGGTTSVSLPVDRDSVSPYVALPPDIGAGGGMVNVIAALRGAEVVVRNGSRRESGQIVGVEYPTGGPAVSLISDGGVLTSVPLTEETEVRFVNDNLALAIRQSLDMAGSTGDWRPIDVTVRLGSDGRHDIAMAYVVAMPVWKPAYRVVVREDETLLLQGWAVVDNISGENWEDVRLSLTAGTPLSFRYDIHSPIFVERPDLTGYGVPDIAQLAPPSPIQSVPMQGWAEGGEMTGLGRGGGGMGYGSFGGAPAPSSAPGGPYWEDGEYDLYERVTLSEEVQNYDDGSTWDVSSDDFASSGGQSADVTDIGPLFRFDIPGHVSVPDQSSTLVTLINERVEGEDVLLYQPGSSELSYQHPYRALNLRNSTGYPIQPAPMTIFSEATFIGEGIAPAIPPGEEATVPYAFEGRVEVREETLSTSGEVVLVRIANGLIRVERELVQDTEYTVTSTLDEASKLFVQLPRMWGYELENDAREELQVHDGYYLIPVDAAVGETMQTERQIRREPTDWEVFTPQVREVFAAYLTNEDARPDVVAVLRPIQDQLAEFASIEGQISDQREIRSELQVRTGELRANIATLGTSETNRELRQELTERLMTQERQLDEVNARIVELQERQAAIRVELNEMLESLTLDVR